jgi:8-oxo-dGTP pyrophosphatase MutT (NUDIX family)
MNKELEKITMKNEKKEKFIMAVMVFVFDEKKNILLLKRTDNGQWEPIKGGINDGENWINAALRELKEESGIVPKTNPELVNIIDDELDTKQGKKTKIKGHVTYCYVAGIKPSINIQEEENGELEHDEYKWISLEESGNEKIWPPITNNLLKEIIEKIK